MAMKRVLRRSSFVFPRYRHSLSISPYTTSSQRSTWKSPWLGWTFFAALTLLSVGQIQSQGQSSDGDSSEDTEAYQFTRWKRREIGLYENKLRTFAHPYKLFNYFASKKDGKRYMTARDFIRCLIPYKPGITDRLPSRKCRVPSAEMFFALADTDGDGLISFEEYILFVTLLTTPEYHWKISFKLFDLNNDGTVSKDEFQKILNRHTSDLSIGRRMGQQETVNTTSDCGIYRLFFGKKGDKPLTFQVFADFMRRLHLEVLKLEFYQYPVDKSDESISMNDFAVAIMSYVDIKDAPKYEQVLSNLPEYKERVTFQQFYDFHQMVRTRLHDLGLAYRFYSLMNLHQHGFTKAEFHRVLKSVTKCDLSAGQVDVLFDVFDSNKDGTLDASEFYKVLQVRSERGLTASSQPYETPFQAIKHYINLKLFGQEDDDDIYS